MSARGAVLFDVDGTLVDSNYHHVLAWQRAFAEVGHEVQARRIHERIGKDGSALVSELLGDAAQEEAQRAKDLHTRYYLDLAQHLQRLPGARELLSAVADRGLAVVLASSAGADEASMLRRVLGADDLIDEFLSGGDVDEGKPAVDVVVAALERVGVPAERAVFVGDAVWDVAAASRLRIPTLALLSGGIAAPLLRDAGAAAVYADPRDLVAHLDRSPIAALPSGW